MIEIKLKPDLVGKHVYTPVFCGRDGQTMANCGTVTMLEEEWDAFAGALLLGASDDDRVSVVIDVGHIKASSQEHTCKCGLVCASLSDWEGHYALTTTEALSVAHDLVSGPGAATHYAIVAERRRKADAITQEEKDVREADVSANEDDA